MDRTLLPDTVPTDLLKKTDNSTGHAGTGSHSSASTTINPTPCTPRRTSRNKPISHARRRNRIKIMVRRLKDWRRVATRYDKCPKVFLAATALAASVMFRL